MDIFKDFAIGVNDIIRGHDYSFEIAQEQTKRENRREEIRLMIEKEKTIQELEREKTKQMQILKQKSSCSCSVTKYGRNGRPIATHTISTEGGLEDLFRGMQALAIGGRNNMLTLEEDDDEEDEEETGRKYRKAIRY